MSRAAIILFLPLTGLFGACDDDISSASQLRRLRLLAVQVEPPNPALGQSTRLRPLIYLPAGESVSYEWSWCPVPTTSEDGYKCSVDQATVDGIAAAAGFTAVPPLFLGNGETAEFTNPFPPTLLASLCAGDSAATSLFFEGASGSKNRQLHTCTLATLSVQVMLTIRGGSTTDTGVVSLRLPIDGSTAGNQNPIVAGVSVLAPDPIQLDETGLVTVARDAKVKLRANLDQTQAEVYLDRQLGPNDEYLTDDTGQFVLGPTVERLTLSWFSEGGGFVERNMSWGVEDRDSDDRPIALDSALENEWSTPSIDDYAAPSSLVLVVVRDSRGGVAWTHGIASLEGAP